MTINIVHECVHKDRLNERCRSAPRLRKVLDVRRESICICLD